MSRRVIRALCSAFSSLALIGCGTGDKAKTIDATDDTTVLVDLPDGQRIELPTGSRIDAKKELAALEAKALEQVPAPVLVREAPAAVVDYLVARTAARRAAWVAKETALPRAATPPPLNTNELKVSQFGRINGSFEISRIDDDAVVLKNNVRGSELFAYSGVNTSGLIPGRFLSIIGTFEVYRTGTFGTNTLPVIRPKSLFISKDPGKVELADLAESRHQEAAAKESIAQRNFETAHAGALEKALRDATAEATRKAPIPTGATAPDQIRSRMTFERLERQLQDAAREKVRELYSVPK